MHAWCNGTPSVETRKSPILGRSATFTSLGDATRKCPARLDSALDDGCSLATSMRLIYYLCFVSLAAMKRSIVFDIVMTLLSSSSLAFGNKALFAGQTTLRSYATVRAASVSRNHRVVVVGAGAASLGLSYQLLRSGKFAPKDIAVVDPAQWHHY